MSDFRIQSLDAKYIGPFEHLFIEFKEKPGDKKDEAEVHIFTGENGTGKSTILYLLTTYPNTHLIKPRIQLANFENFYTQIKYKSYPVTDDIIYQYDIGGLTIEGFNKGLIGEYFFAINNSNLAISSSYNFGMFAYSGYRKIDNPKLDTIREIIDNPLKDALNFASSTNSQLLLQWIANTISREALTFRNGEEVEANKYKLSLTKLQKAIENIIGGNFEFVLLPKEFNVFVIWNGVQTTFEVLPDGLKSIISWLGDLLMRLDRIEWATEADIFDRNFILFLDEIDIHLHPAWQRKILPVIKKLFKNAQIFISTHSPFVIGSVDGAWVYKLKKEGQYSVLVGEPMLSEDAKSYDLILDEIFGIKQRFGIDIEKKLELFYDFRSRILKDELAYDNEGFHSLIDYFAAQNSIELESIIGMELRQLKRLKGIKENIHA